MSSNLVKVIVDHSKPRSLSADQREELARLAAMTDASIDYSDIPPTDFANAIPFRERPLFKPVKRSTTLRLDADVLSWLRAKGKGYQTRINAILREAMMREGS